MPALSARWSADVRRLLRSAPAGTLSECGAHFEVLDSLHGWHAVVFLQRQSTDDTPCWQPGDWLEPLSDLLQRWNSTGHRVLKESPSSMVFQTKLQVGGTQLQAICKQGRVQGLIRRLGTSRHGPKEFREFWAGQALLAVGLQTPLPLACLWQRIGRFEIRARLLTAFLDDAKGLDQTLTALTARRRGRLLSPEHPAALKTLSTRVGHLVGGLGEHGLAHRDLKSSNIMVSGQGMDLRPWLIDLDGLHGDVRPYGPGFVRSLARLGSSVRRTARVPRSRHVGMLKQAISNAPPQPWKSWWRRIEAVNHKAARKQDRTKWTSEV